MQNKPVLILHKAPHSENHHRSSRHTAADNIERIRKRPGIDQISELPDIEVHRIQMRNSPLNPFREGLDRIEYGRQVHPCRCHRVVNILHILEEYIGLRQKHSESQAKKVQLQNDKREQQVDEPKRCARNQHDQHQSRQIENEINQTAGHLRKTEDVLGNIGLLNQRSVPDDGIHGLGRCRSHVIEKQLSGKQVDREIRDVSAEHG